jgi:transposase
VVTGGQGNDQAMLAGVLDEIAARLRRGRRGGRPPAFDEIGYKQRNLVERSFALLKQWRGLATRYDKLAIVYRAAGGLSAYIIWTRHPGDTLSF